MDDKADVSGVDGNVVLADLDLAEESIRAITRLAEETVRELQHLPTCDVATLEALSTEYLERVRAVQVVLKRNSKVLRPYILEGDDSNYLDKKSTEINAILKN